MGNVSYIDAVVAEARALFAFGYSDRRIERELAEKFPDQSPTRITIGRWRATWREEEPEALTLATERIARKTDIIVNAKLDEVLDEIEETGTTSLPLTQVFIPWGIVRDKYQKDQQMAAYGAELAQYQRLVEQTVLAMQAAGKNPAGAFARLSAPVDAEVTELPAD